MVARRFVQGVAVSFLFARGVWRLIVRSITLPHSTWRPVRAAEAVRDITQPIKYVADSSTAVVLFHGWTATPWEFRVLARVLRAAGVAVYAPLLPGHGTVPRDLEDVDAQAMIRAALMAYDGAQRRHERVIVGGASMGALLAFIVAQRRRVHSVIAITPPLVLRVARQGLAFLRIVRTVRRYEPKYYAPWQHVPRVVRQMTYQSFPLDSVFMIIALVQAVREGGRINAPVWAFFAQGDAMVAPRSRAVLRTMAPRAVVTTYATRAHNILLSTYAPYIIRTIRAVVVRR